MLRRIGTLFLAICCALSSAVAVATSWQSLDSVRDAAAAHVRDQLEPGAPVARVEAGTLDARLRLAACDGPLATFAPAGARRGANTTVGVRCDGPQPWKIYVPVRVEREARVLVATRALARDAVLRPEDVTLAERDPDRLPQGYVTTSAEVAGMRLRRAVPAGSVVTPAMLVAVPLISSGQQVTLEAGGDDMHIRMAGQALADAGLGQRVRVRNVSSERVVEGIVRSAQVVEVLLK